MAVFSKRQSALTRKLTRTVTGFEPNEENFMLCFQFAKLNFKFHRFLDVNDLNVTSSIAGLKQKFEVHSQPEKASSLQLLVNKFLSLHLEGSYPNSDTHYGLLLFLLCLSHSPVNNNFEVRVDSPIRPVHVNDFDWAGHLMEGIWYQKYDSDSGSEWSDSPSSTSHVTAGTNHSLDDSVIIGEELSDRGISPPLSHSLLLEQVHIPYWDVSNPQHQVDLNSLCNSCLTGSAHPACCLATVWNSYVLSVAPLLPPQEDLVTLTEWQVVRETLWVCLGAESSFVYQINGSDVRPQKNIQVLHLTPLSLQNQLLHFSGFISMLRVLRKTHQGVTFAPITPCKTYEAFSSSLRVCLHQLEDHIREIERMVLEKVSMVTLVSLEVHLGSVYSTVQQLHSLIITVLEQQPSPPTAFSLASSILSTLWTFLSHVDSLGESGHASLCTLLPLWLTTVRPYFDFIQRWINEGVLDAKWEEFCIQREVCGEEDWSWVSGFSLQQPVPAFLQLVIHQVLQAGKSIHVLEAVGKRKEMDTPVSPISLYEEFLSSLKSNSSHDSPVMSLDKMSGSHDKRMDIWRLDPLAQHYISYLPMKLGEQLKGPTDQLWEVVSSVRVNSASLPLTLQHTLFTLLTARCHKSSSGLVKLLTQQYQLGNHFKTVQRFFLMADGPVMHHFTCDIFQRIHEGGEWQDSFYLNNVLHQALQGQLADSAELEQRLRVVYTPPSGTSYLSPLSCLSLHYFVPWPLAMVFPPHLMDTYNKVFQLLLTVNWAKWSLETVHMKQIEVTRLSLELQTQARLLLLLRARLLYFVNNLTNYLMTRILHSVGAEFEIRVQSAEDVDTILQLHSQYTDTLFDRCLLNKKASIVKEAIMKVLNLATTFKRYWERGVANFNRETAKRIEDEFSKCSHFLVSCLNNTVKRGTFPHLETLAFSMQTLKTDYKVFS